MKSLLLFLSIHLSLFQAEAVDLDALHRAINNTDISLRDSGKSLVPVVGANLPQYKATEKIIWKSDKFYLRVNDYKADDSRLSVAHKLADESYHYTTLHLDKGNVKRATECKKKLNIYWGLGNKYSCQYASENVCRHLDRELKNYTKSFNECKDMAQNLKKVLPYSVKDYERYVNREMGRVKEFSNNFGVERLTDFVSNEDIDKVQNQSIFLFNEISENIHVCQKYFSHLMSKEVGKLAPNHSQKSKSVN